MNANLEAPSVAVPFDLSSFQRRTSKHSPSIDDRRSYRGLYQICTQQFAVVVATNQLQLSVPPPLLLSTLAGAVPEDKPDRSDLLRCLCQRKQLSIIIGSELLRLTPSAPYTTRKRSPWGIRADRIVEFNASRGR
ncbi:hypothetical protein Trydic_g17513 [Trypoxylus dichotomus]